MSLPLRGGEFGDWSAIDFNTNEATWTAPSDGFVLVRFNGVTTDAWIYVYVNNMVCGSISIKSSTGGYTYTTTIPVAKGKTLTLATNQSSSIVSLFMPINR